MAVVVLYKYINCAVDKLLALTLVTNYITNYSKIIIFLYYQLLFQTFENKPISGTNLAK